MSTKAKKHNSRKKYQKGVRNYVPPKYTAGDIIGSSLGLGQTGAQLGSVAGPIGSAIGGGVGLVGGAIKGLFDKGKRDEEIRSANIGNQYLDAIESYNINPTEYIDDDYRMGTRNKRNMMDAGYNISSSYPCGTKYKMKKYAYGTREVDMNWPNERNYGYPSEYERMGQISSNQGGGYDDDMNLKRYDKKSKRYKNTDAKRYRRGDFGHTGNTGYNDDMLEKEYRMSSEMSKMMPREVARLRGQYQSGGGIMDESNYRNGTRDIDMYEDTMERYSPEGMYGKGPRFMRGGLPARGKFYYEDGARWIQGVNEDIERRGTKGVCTGDKFGGPSCPPGSKRYNLAKTFKKMAKNRKKEDGTDYMNVMDEGMYMMDEMDMYAGGSHGMMKYGKGTKYRLKGMDRKLKIDDMLRMSDDYNRDKKLLNSLSDYDLDMMEMYMYGGQI